MWSPWSKPAPPPPPPKGLLLSTYEVVDWRLVFGVHAAHFVLAAAFYLVVGSRRNEGAIMGGADSDNVTRGAKAKRGSLLANVLAYNCLAVVYASYCSYVGTTAWFDGSAAAVGGSLHDRIYGYSEPYAKMAAMTIAYELYNTLAVLFLHEYRNAEFIGHHSTCLVLGLISTHPFCHYYATFFFGLTAISSVPLALIEFMQICKLPEAEELCRVIFCIVFLIFRTVYW